MTTSLGNRSFQGLGLHAEFARRLDDLQRQTGANNQAIATTQAAALSTKQAEEIARAAVAQGVVTGLSITITTAKLTSGGTEGAMTFVNGVLTDQVPAT